MIIRGHCAVWTASVLPSWKGYREGFLWKRGRDNGQYLSRRFILSEREGVLKYFNKHDVSLRTFHRLWVKLASSAAHVFTFCRPESLKRWWRSVPWTQHSSHPRSAPPTGCRSPTWRTTARGTSLFITRKERWSPFPPSSGHDWHYTPTSLKRIWKLKLNLTPCLP